MTKPVEIWIDAIDFTNKGGWKEDTQFVHLMGSGYLIAADIPGVPVADAKITVEIPKKDTYRIWVRDRNWYRPHNPGTFQLLVNGQSNGTVLGAMPSDAWVWESAGDYTLEAGNLEIVTSQQDLSVLADGKLLWRIMDNLLNNVMKYAMSGTRVYVTAGKGTAGIVIAVKNISRDPLNVDAEELMERFVRGGASRHTEGSGLGLNIVRSLTEIQNGVFTLTVDGDLFKAEMSLPSA